MIATEFNIIVAFDDRGGIARSGEMALPWQGTDAGRNDMKWFRTTTADSIVIMGRKTWETLKAPLIGRYNIVLTTNTTGITIHGALTNSPVAFAPSLDTALEHCVGKGRAVFVIGGLAVYKQALLSPYLRQVMIGRIDGDFNCDMFFPVELLPGHHISKGPQDIYTYVNTHENEYLQLISTLIGLEPRENRTGVPTMSILHHALTFDLHDMRGPILPLLTTKKVILGSVFHELMWFLRGNTNAEWLQGHGVHIWDGNSTKEYLATRGLEYPPGNVGPIYGYQWRYWNSPYACKDDPLADDIIPSPGVDQLAETIENIKTDPYSRRHVVVAWNPEQNKQMALEPCHYAFQFYVDSKDGRPHYLSCVVNMRSADVALGVPFNIASYALLTHIVANICGLTAHRIVISMVNCHIYTSHIEALRVQLARETRRFPTFRIKRQLKGIDDAMEMSLNDIELGTYAHHPFIKMQMVV
jgi:thymidylate synthase